MGNKWSLSPVAVFAWVLLTGVVVGVVVGIGIPAYQDYHQRALEAAAAKVADAAEQSEQQNTCILGVSVPDSFGDDYWIYVNGHIWSAPPRKKSGSEEGFQLRAGEYTIEVAFLSDRRGKEFPFAIHRFEFEIKIKNGICEEVRPRAIWPLEQLHFGVPNDAYIPAGAKRRTLACGSNGEPEVQDLQQDMDHFVNDPVVRALNALDVSALSNSKDTVVLDLSPAEGGVRDFDRAQIRYIAEGVLQTYEEPSHEDVASCKNDHPEFSQSLDAYDGLLSDFGNQLQHFHTLAEN